MQRPREPLSLYRKAQHSAVQCRDYGVRGPLSSKNNAGTSNNGAHLGENNLMSVSCPIAALGGGGGDDGRPFDSLMRPSTPLLNYLQPRTMSVLLLLSLLLLFEFTDHNASNGPRLCCVLLRTMTVTT